MKKPKLPRDPRIWVGAAVTLISGVLGLLKSPDWPTALLIMSSAFGIGSLITILVLQHSACRVELEAMRTAFHRLYEAMVESVQAAAEGRKVKIPSFEKLFSPDGAIQVPTVGSPKRRRKSA